MSEVVPPLRGRRVGRRPFWGSHWITLLLTLACALVMYFTVPQYQKLLMGVAEACPPPEKCAECVQKPCPKSEVGNMQCAPCQCTCVCPDSKGFR
jgi:hypothetical protein